jgi:hypothetical protein
MVTEGNILPGTNTGAPIFSTGPSVEAGLINSFDKTNLDLENSYPLGGPNNDLTTNYPSTNTGTPTLTANPGPPSRFIQTYTPTNTYLSQINDRIIENSPLSNNKTKPSILAITNLDNTDEGVDGGVPYKSNNDPTVYPPTTQPAVKFGVVSSNESALNARSYTPTNTYLDYIEPFTR